MASPKTAPRKGRPLEQEGSSDKNPESSKRQKSGHSAPIKLESSSSSPSQDFEESETNWKRPSAPALDSNNDSLIFQQIEIEETVSASDSKPLVRMYGITKESATVLCTVHNFFPYFYFPAPNGLVEDDIVKLHNVVEEFVGKNTIQNIEVVDKQSIYGYYSGDLVPFIKMSVNNPRSIAAIRRALKAGISFGRFENYSPQTFESNLEYLLRFMIDTKVVGGNWIELPPGNYRLSKSQVSHCQYEVDVSYDKFISHAPDNEWSQMGPLRVLSFDIECAGRKGIFPEAAHDPIIQIASIVQVHGSATPLVRNIFSFGGCAPIAGAQVHAFDNEAVMLLAWSKFFQTADPDLVIGYNTTNFDLPYVLDRAHALGLDDFPYLGRVRNIRTTVKESHFSSKAYGSRDTKVINMEGRLQLDMLQVMQRDYKLRSYSLNAVCEHFLGETKEDVHYSIITDLWKGDDETRRRLAVYCIKDAYLPLRLMDKLMCLINYMEMARVTGVPFSYLLSRGQQIKVVSQLYRKAIEKNLLIPHREVEGSMEQYEGATVIEPEKGYYTDPIATLDFASLYPSIMMAHNLCYTTLIDRKSIERLGLVEGQDYIRTPKDDHFVTASRRKGLLPIILEDLISARKRAKADLKKESDPFKKAVLDGRQLALKISANSVYGFTGANVGKLPCLQISSSVTAYGREMINQTQQLVEAEFPNAHVIYGDTDSVMVNFHVKSIEEAMVMGRRAAEFVSGHFIKPISLEFEKVYCPYLLINKKRYAGLYWTNHEKYDKLDTKGIETVRRDSCQLVSTVIGTCLHKALIDKDPDGAAAYAKRVISDLLQNKIDMSQLVLTKSLAKLDYTSKQPHSVLAEKMRVRDAGSAPALGDRVAYVMIKGSKDSKGYDRSEDPIYVLENNISIDTQYYLENQLSKPLLRIFDPILGEAAAKTLLTGEHTRTVLVRAPASGMMANFAVKMPTCLSCKVVLKDKATAVCERCRPRLPELYRKEMESFNDLEVRFSRLWAECQRCQGSLHNDVLCSSKDCPIFYMRAKARKDADASAATLKRFDYSW
ncbi:DNA-directed DNA polymerase delta [Entomophthora muscae]|uniref:DNA-directed DNA polymerase delta n=1 Tax=Entomophthora muscae TaxID=34485 RepID=A0ACC2UF90_9FUNG|nr:DNA-directed DNA polymerase delta [Entomophthora muscae]